MILRHITNLKHLKDIVADGCLNNSKGTCRNNSHDSGRNYFEEYKGNDVLLEKFPEMKKALWEVLPEMEKDWKEVIALDFDAEKMLADGLLYKKSMDDNKKQLEEYKFFTQEEINAVGDFYYIPGTVSLKYLTTDSKDKLKEYVDGIKS